MMAVRGLVAAVERAGVERARFLADVGLQAQPLADVYARVPAETYARVLHHALCASGDPALGLHLGERAGTGTFDAFGYLTEHSSCLREALSHAMHYSRIVTDGPQLELHEHGTLFTLRLRLNGADPLGLRFAAEFSTAALLKLMRHFVGEGARAERVSFSYAAPAYRSEYARVFDGRELFEQDGIGMTLPRAWLERAPECHSRELSALLEKRADVLLAQVDQVAPAAERVKRWLAHHADGLRPAWPTMEDVAHDLGMSARSLRRRLQLEHTEFSSLVEDALADRAKHMLADPRRSVQETAYSMGFGTPSAFSRAFKRWTGVAPTAFRRVR